MVRCRGYEGRIGCVNLLTWAEQRRQYGRLFHAGFSLAEIRAVMPICQRCTTAVLASSSPGRHAARRTGEQGGG